MLYVSYRSVAGELPPGFRENGVARIYPSSGDHGRSWHHVTGKCPNCGAQLDMSRASEDNPLGLFIGQCECEMPDGEENANRGMFGLSAPYALVVGAITG